MNSALEDVVRLGGLALQAEDCLIRAAVHHRGEHGGLVRMENERHHQFLIWRAVLPIWHAVLEKENSTDLIVSRDRDKHYFELKNWRGANGNEQLPAIRRDVQKLLQWGKGYLLITSVNPRDQTDENIAYLLSHVRGLNNTERREFRFNTVGIDGADLGCWIAGWPVIREDINS